MVKGLGSRLLAVVLAGVLPACSLLPASGPRSDDVNANATAGIRSTASLPYALVDVSADTIGFLSQPKLVTFKGTFVDTRPKPLQVVGIGDVPNISIFEAQPGGLFTPGQASGARPGNFVDTPPREVDQIFTSPTRGRSSRQDERYRPLRTLSSSACTTARSNRKWSSA